MPIFPCRNWNALNCSHCALSGISCGDGLAAHIIFLHSRLPAPDAQAGRQCGAALGGGPAGRILLLPAFFVFCGGRGGSPAQWAARGRGLGAPRPPAPPCPALVPGAVTARRRRGSTAPSAHAAQAARSIHGTTACRRQGSQCTGARQSICVGQQLLNSGPLLIGMSQRTTHDRPPRQGRPVW